MKTEKQIRSRLKKLEKEMDRQVAQGMENGWPVPFWDYNCVEREVLRSILGMRRKPFCAADVFAGI
ncbi:MAG TPA: hypothetical protein VNH83_28275 [Bryobacteraceae bacterium]|nr:hypothetical protein [Bryobacteraceae bacterium]